MNLPPGTQEGLLQQTLEKYATISRIEVFHKKNQATVELASIAVGFLVCLAD
jgi:squamous cell carcinoma antigen recognized by T-cells 3